MTDGIGINTISAALPIGIIDRCATGKVFPSTLPAQRCELVSMRNVAILKVAIAGLFSAS